VIPDTLADVLAYKKPEEKVERWEKFEFEDGRAYTKRVKFNFNESRRYHRLQNLWKNNVIRKKKRKERRLLRLAEKQPVPPGPIKLVVHAPIVREIVVTRQVKHNSFAVIMLNGRQYKVVEDDLILVNQLKNLKVGDVVEAERVLLVGTKEYTLLGRPMVEGAKVVMTVESQAKAKKVIVFKKKRRKGYRRSYGHRSLQTFLRVHLIEFDVAPELASRAIPLWRPPQMG
jgi:large subunit ribosomal protein L21